MAELQVEIVAADHFVWSGAAKLVKARSVDGEIGVLPGHVPMLSVLAAGDLEIEPVSESRFSVQIDGGFFSVDSDRVVIVADNAVLGTAA
ncbi:MULTISPECIES: F0F1 ATP synthase subunit epsilon [Micrococcaceae]|jgi:F-type H+-transporting ATPase subunit epsilon|uniref:ATP synthase epsilon chain n=2 Tax=Glutamicibacter TaxID=1742989 RepID=A0ABX4MW18_9MICC|nr:MULTISPECIES: F0F1 ATP synthase subunit epsilon [Micrococcaceae]KWR73401.1 ATP synthase F0F1 subunit epsilon [Arthrobacter sp. W1]MCS3494168.1 F-type H+-transporting ATPase subunit epsilon [Arthrobacter sp. JUb119]MDV2975672.1 F0F1 ATP synthase subunit epsilon [Actinomycetes bacterium ARC8]MBM7768123.1 F-type H+-transporting ATPase subunit epsilon [Glutamicibacter nicotianae]PJJ43498.1 F-type H+-transporting ATPase subunit epsilon [Glutamicibacter mysorens]